MHARNLKSPLNKFYQSDAYIGMVFVAGRFRSIKAMKLTKAYGSLARFRKVSEGLSVVGRSVFVNFGA